MGSVYGTHTQTLYMPPLQPCYPSSVGRTKIPASYSNNKIGLNVANYCKDSEKTEVTLHDCVVLKNAILTIKLNKHILQIWV